MAGWLLVALSAGPASAHPAGAFEGRAPAVGRGLDARIWVWHDGGELHIRFTTGGERRRFSGVLTSEPPLATLLARTVRAAGDDAVALRGVRIETAPDGTVRFSARTAGGLAGVDLPALDVPVRIELSLDDTPAPVHVIRLGAREVRPRRNPFEVPPRTPALDGDDHHAHAHAHPHRDGGHHDHPHPHPHPPGPGHHHPW